MMTPMGPREDGPIGGGTAVPPYGRLAAVYDAEWSSWSRQYRELLVALLAGKGRARVIDLGCGTGELVAWLTASGHDVVGVDASPEMVARAASKAPGATLAVRDMATVEWNHDFDLAICTFDSFNYLLTEERVRAFFGSAARLLGASGRLVFDANGERLYRLRHHGSHELDLAGRRLRRDCHWDPSRRLATTRFAFDDGAIELHEQRPWDLAELRAPIAGAGLQVEAAYSAPSREPWSEGDERLVCVCRRAVRALTR